MDKNETFSDAMAKLKARLDCPTDTKLPVKGEWCGLFREICDADGTNFCDRNSYLSTVLAVEAAHEREVGELKTQIRIARTALFKICMCDHSQKIHDIFCEAEFMMNHLECEEDREWKRITRQ